MDTTRSPNATSLCTLAAGAALGPWAFGQGALAWLWWLGLLGPLAGGCAGYVRSWKGAALVVLVWMGVWWISSGRSGVFHRVGGLGAVSGLIMLGFGVVRLGVLGAGPGGLAWLLIGTLLASALPSGAGWFGPAPWSPEWAARLLDISPVALAHEAAGVDFLRLEAVYGPVGADAIGPSLRIAWGALAGWGALVVGCGLGVAGSRWFRSPQA